MMNIALKIGACNGFHTVKVLVIAKSSNLMVQWKSVQIQQIMKEIG